MGLLIIILSISQGVATLYFRGNRKPDCQYAIDKATVNEILTLPGKAFSGLPNP
jgi:hypothetical protein